MLGVIILKERKVQLKTRVTEKVRTQNKAKKCGLSVSKYVRKRALNYAPKAILPESFYEFTEKLGALYEGLGALGNAELQKTVLKLIDDVYVKLLITDKSTNKTECEGDD